MKLNYRIWDTSAASGGLTLSYTAAGRLDFDMSIGAKPWDYAAGALIAREAGAKVTDFQGKPYRWDSEGVIAANPALHKKIMAAIK